MTKEQTEKKEETFEEAVRREAKERAKDRNRFRLIKWLTIKDSAIAQMESDIETMIENCKNGNFSDLPELSEKEEDKLQGWTGVVSPTKVFKNLTNNYTPGSTTITNLAQSIIP